MRLRPALPRILPLLVLCLAAVAFAPASARAQGFIDPCLACGHLYASDGSGQLHLIDTDAGTSTFIGFHGLTMFDIGITSDGQLLGVDGGGGIWLIDSCTAAVTPVGGAGGFANGLTGDLASNDLFAQGPPLLRIDGTTYTTTVVGGSTPGPPPGWCGSSTGDLAMSPEDGLLYSTVFCPACGNDTLLAVDPATGGVVSEVGCVVESGTGIPAFGVFGLAFDASCRLLGGVQGSSSLLHIDVATAQYVQIPITGSYSGAFGLASVPCPGATCGATAEECSPLTQGFWKRQCRGPHPSGEHEQLPSRIACVGATDTFGGTASADELCARLHPEPPSDKCLQAEAQFMALLLNACSGRLSRSCCIESSWSDATTVGEAIDAIDAILSDPARTFADCVRAQGLADDINTAGALCAEPPAASASGSGPAAAISPRMGDPARPADPSRLRRAGDGPRSPR